jgi:hypothetical protein
VADHEAIAFQRAQLEREHALGDRLLCRKLRQRAAQVGMAPRSDHQHLQDQGGPAVAHQRHHGARGIGPLRAVRSHVFGQGNQAGAQHGRESGGI